MEGLCDTEETKSEEEAPRVEMPHAEGSNMEIFYYWSILPEELCQRWQVEKATQ